MEKEITIDDIIILSDLIKKFNTDRIKGEFKLSTEQKISFAFNYYENIGNKSIINILKKSIDTNKSDERKKIINFICANKLNRKIPDVINETAGPLNFHAKDITSEEKFIYFSHNYNQHNWLEEYDLDYEFDNDNIRIQSPTIVSMIDKNGNRIIIDKEKAKTIKNSIIQNNIFPSYQIVRQGFNPYVKDEMDKYIAKVKSYGNSL